MRLAGLVLVRWTLALGAVGCASGADTTTSPPPPLAVTLESLWVPTVLPGTRAWIRGDGFLDGAELEATLTGTIDGRVADVALVAERVDDRTVALDFGPSVVAPLGEGTLTGTLHLTVEVGAAHGEAEAAVVVQVAQQLAPQLTAVPGGAFPQSPFTLTGDGFLLEGEGQTVFSLRGAFLRERDAESADISLTEIPLTSPADGVPGPPSRTSTQLLFDPAWIGIEPGTFDGEIRVGNRGRGWAMDTDWQPAHFDLLPPTIETVSPQQGSRGERIGITGQGFIGGDDRATFLRLEGIFQPRGGEPRDLGAGMEISPVWLSGTSLAFSMRVHYDYDCLSEDLGATPGTMNGTVTPITTSGNVVVEGVPAPLTFQILPSRQVVWLRFLPAFTESLITFGLRNVSGPIQDRVLEVLQRDYAGINVDFRLYEPTDFLDHGILELGGPDPNGQNLFGLDNTPNLDHCNERLADNLAGRHADSGGYGGIFVESFHQFSPRGESGNPLADPLFDEIFDPVKSRPVASGEFPGGPRAGVIQRAITTLGTLIGNTATHEIGHSLGLPVSPGCGEYHTAAGDLQLMDCGGDRPFRERAEIDGQPAVFNPEDMEYLYSVLPL